MVNLSNSLVGLSLMTGGNAFASIGAPISFESRAVRLAKAQFDAPPTTPPWKEEPDSRPVSAQLSAIKAMRTIIDKAATGPDALPADVQTSFTAYKALERLRIIAEAATSKTASDAQRKSLDATFQKGMADLKTFLGSAPTDKVNLAFGTVARYIKSPGIPMPDKYASHIEKVVTNRADPIAGLTGNERFTLTLSKSSGSDTVTVDLSTGPQPPTLDSVIESFNAAIASVPMRNPDGTLYLDPEGNSVPRWSVSLEAEKNNPVDEDEKGGWGFKINTPSGTEQLSIVADDGQDALIVAAGQTALDAPTTTRMFRLDDPAGAATQTSIGTIAGADRLATERAQLLAEANPPKIVVKSTKTGEEPPEPNYEVPADTDTAAIATDAFGNSYIVGTTNGDMGAHRSDGEDNMFLTKVDSQGKVLWQRALGGGGVSEGAAVTVGADGSVTVAGTVNRSFGGTSSDGDMVVAQFSADGDERFATVVRSAGADSASAVAVGADGSIFVAGTAGTIADGSTDKDGFITRLDSSGRIVERRKIAEGGSEQVTAMAIDGDGNLLALVNRDGAAQLRRIDSTALSSDLGSIDLGNADARAIAVASDGTIAVGGTTVAALNGNAVNAMGSGRDGFVARIDAGFTSASVTYLATDKEDQVDSLTFHNGSLYVGGRTAGGLGEAAKSGAVDGYVARLDAATGAVANITQFGQPGLRTEPVQVAVAKNATSSLSALGLSAGPQMVRASEKLVGQTGMRPGDSFGVRLNDGTVRKITIAADETMETLANKIRFVTGSRVKVSTPLSEGSRVLRLDPKAGNSIDLVAGPEGRDALAHLGLTPQRIAMPETLDEDAPKVRPGGNYSLSLSLALTVSTQDDAKVALKQMEAAVSMSQSAYRSLYWDDGKAALVDGGRSNNAVRTGTGARANAQLANYQAALSRLSSPSTTTGFF